MKAFVLLLTLAVASRFVDVESKMTVPQIKTALKTVRKACQTKSGAAKELVEATYGGDFAEDRGLMCFYKCSMGMMQMLKDGKFDAGAATSQAVKNLPDEFLDRIIAVIKRCTPEITSSDDCEGPWQYVKCAWHTDSEAYFFP